MDPRQWMISRRSWKAARHFYAKANAEVMTSGKSEAAALVALVDSISGANARPAPRSRRHCATSLA